MPLSLQDRRVGDIAVVTCTGRITEGGENTSLQRYLDEVLVYGADIVLNLAGVSFVDSSGLGLLVRYVTRAQRARGNLKLCCVDRHVKEVLRITKLNTVLETYDTEDAAIADFYSASGTRPSDAPDVSILCIEPSADVLAYVRELLKQAGFSVVSVTNLPDALILMRAARPRMIVINADLHALVRSTHASGSFNSLSAQVPVIELAADFGVRDPAEAGQELLERVRPVLGGTATPAR